ncbi:MAG TPA: restriction endonuclease [Bacteroidia bacterium]|nr:restriction endonuclease [Bacteroidia bacterium]HRS58498.1 restriction endonuclease [Bacteroidia bacterium]HRU68529.1 restriction endonuclease [Bacteroidia bacterium]
MPIPDFQTIMLPLLAFTGDNNEHSLRETIEHLANHFNLTPEERQEMLTSGTQAIFDNRVSWAKTHLLKAGLLESPRRSIFKITLRGQQILGQNHENINMNLLKQFPEYLEFIRPSNDHEERETAIEQIDNSLATPEEVLESSYQKIRRTLAQELLLKIKASPPAFFERLVVELLVKMGYGGSIKDAGKATRVTNDEGIDGIIKEDKLGLDFIYIQAKRWDNQAVGRPDIQSFVGALDGQRANKGIFITTSRFSDTAIEYVRTITKKVILIDGEQLANFMIDYGLGVSTFATYELKKIDNDYFGE